MIPVTKPIVTLYYTLKNVKIKQFMKHLNKLLSIITIGRLEQKEWFQLNTLGDSTVLQLTIILTK